MRIAARPLRLAAIDVGSNSIHMVMAQAEPGGGITTIGRMKEMVGLGRISFPSKRLTREAIRRALLVLARFQHVAAQRGVEKVIAVATSAVREAENGGDFIERAWNQLALRIRIVSAREEARLIYLAVRYAVKLKRQPHLIIDIGGGSVEFIVGDQRQARVLESRKLGAARMTASFIRSDPISDSDREVLVQHYRKELAAIRKSIGKIEFAGTIGTSGTLENLASMSGGVTPAVKGRESSAVIEITKFQELLAKLLKSDSEHRAKFPGLDEKRQDQIVSGALLVDEIFKAFRIRRIHICPMALREGILLDYLARHVPDMTIRREVPDPRRRSVLDLARRCDWNRVHSERVAALTLQLFDETKSLHGLTAPARELLQFAALLHEIGWHISGKSHHKHSMYLILNGELKSFEKEEVAIMANIARYHRKAGPKLTHGPYAALSRDSKRIVDVGAAILRIADGLDRSHCSVIHAVHAKFDDHRMTLTLSARADAQLEVWAARRKRDLFEKTFHRHIDFELSKR